MAVQFETHSDLLTDMQHRNSSLPYVHLYRLHQREQKEQAFKMTYGTHQLNYKEWSQSLQSDNEKMFLTYHPEPICTPQRPLHKFFADPHRAMIAVGVDSYHLHNDNVALRRVIGLYFLDSVVTSQYHAETAWNQYMIEGVTFFVLYLNDQLTNLYAIYTAKMPRSVHEKKGIWFEYKHLKQNGILIDKNPSSRVGYQKPQHMYNIYINPASKTGKGLLDREEPFKFHEAMLLPGVMEIRMNPWCDLLYVRANPGISHPGFLNSQPINRYNGNFAIFCHTMVQNFKRWNSKNGVHLTDNKYYEFWRCYLLVCVCLVAIAVNAAIAVTRYTS